MNLNILRPTLPVIFISCTLLLCSHSLNAEIYKWVDKQGKVHFTDKPPKNRPVEEVTLKINTYTSVQIKPLVERLGRTNRVVMYSAEWCGICTRAKKYFRKNNIAYISYDIEKSRTGKMDFKRLRGKSVPIIIVGDKRMNGFTAARFDQLYKKQNEIKKIDG